MECLDQLFSFIFVSNMFAFDLEIDTKYLLFILNLKVWILPLIPNK